MKKVPRKYKAHYKDLELQIDYLVGYVPSGNHWKYEYHIRKELIESTINDEQTPDEVRNKIFRIQDTLARMYRNEEQEQGYIYYSKQEYMPKRKVKVNDYHKSEPYYFEL